MYGVDAASASEEEWVSMFCLYMEGGVGRSRFCRMLALRSLSFRESSSMCVHR